MLLLEAAALGAQLEDTEGRRVVDEELGLGQLGNPGLELLVLVILQVALAELLRAELGLGRHEALHQLGRAHLEGKDGHRHPVVHRHVARHGQHEGGLAHAGTGRENHHVRVLPSAGQSIQGLEPGRGAAHPVLIQTSLVDAVHHLLDDGLHVLVILPDVALGHLEQLLL